nr:MAG TPA: hypothetical protein [Caudoviricetes sp.]
MKLLFEVTIVSVMLMKASNRLLNTSFYLKNQDLIILILFYFFFYR